MGSSGGYIFIFDDDERNLLLYYRAQANIYFTDNFSTNELKVRGTRPSLCFLSFNKKEISHAALVHRSNSSVTAKPSVKFYEFVPLLSPIHLDSIKETIGVSLHILVNRIPAKEWSNLLTFIKNIQPNVASALSRLEALVSSSTDFPENFDVDRARDEKDAVGLALKIFGVEFSQELSKVTPTAQPAPFLQGLTHALLTEDSMINHDSLVFGDEWKQQNKYQIDAAEFTNDKGELLTIMNVNRKSVERALGVDLLYYNHNYCSYVMVQYKRMLKEKKGFVYRPDWQCYEEIARMKSFEAQFLEEKQSFHMGDYRLNAGIFFLKLCPSIAYDPVSSDLIKGMYLPLEYWDLLAESPSLQSTQGGMKVTFDNVNRHINNTLFVQLLQAGWIGSQLKRTEALSLLIKQLIESGRSVILASSSSAPDSNSLSVPVDKPPSPAPDF